MGFVSLEITNVWEVTKVVLAVSVCVFGWMCVSITEAALSTGMDL